MFPTFSYLIQYFTGKSIPIEIPTYGFFMLLAFCAAYWTFTIEFKRKENLQIIFPFTRIRKVGGLSNFKNILLSGISGFLIGYKLGYCVFNFHQFLINPQFFIFSIEGNWITAIISMILAGCGYFLKQRSLDPIKPGNIVELVHPYQLMDKLLFWCGVYGFLGAILLAKLERFDWQSWNNFKGIFAYNGLAFYGGLIFGALTYLYILMSKGITFKNAADIGSPGMMLAYGIGRIGCQLSGDGDWGIINLKPRPNYLLMFPDWVWSFNFPHNVAYQGRFIEGCTGRYCNELIYPVYPTSFYEAVICISLFLILWLLRPKIKIPGLIFSIYAIMNGAERFLIEGIRINPRFEIGHFHFSQAELISVLIFFIGVGGLFWSVYTYKNAKIVDK